MSLVAQVEQVLRYFWGWVEREHVLAAPQGPGLSPNQLWVELMGLAVHQHLSVHCRVTLPWRVGTDSGVKRLKPVETCQISPVKTQRCGLWRCVVLHLGHEDSV